MDSENSGDSTDARGLFGRSKDKSTTIPVAIFDGSVDRPDYVMNFPSRGKCFIFNHKEFDKRTGLNTRNGTDADAARLYCQFKELGFEPQLFTDLTVEKVLMELEKAGKDDYSQSACFVCCVLSHGEAGILFARDGKYPTERVFAPFRGDVCPTLVGKPKIFFIQACQGDRLDSGTHIMCRESTDASDAQTYKIPAHADFLIVYSTVPGFYSWRNTTNGSWFIQALCAVLKKREKDMDLLELLTIVNRKVAYDFISYTPNDQIMHLKKQVPCVTSTLTRKILL